MVPCQMLLYYRSVKSLININLNPFSRPVKESLLVGDPSHLAFKQQKYM